MVDIIKSSVEVDRHNPGLLPALQCTLKCMWHTQKCITGTQTFPISNLGGWKHTRVFHKSSETNRHQTLKHLWQYWCYGNWSVIGNKGPFGIGVTLGRHQQAGKLPRRRSRRNTTLRRGARTSAILFKKRGNIPEGQCHREGPSLTGDVHCLIFDWCRMPSLIYIFSWVSHALFGRIMHALVRTIYFYIIIWFSL